MAKATAGRGRARLVEAVHRWRMQATKTDPLQQTAFKGDYAIYSGGLGNQQAPTRDDRKASFIIEGQPAKEIFNNMAPDDKETCRGDKGARSRTKGNVWCTFHPRDRYTCYFGFDLKAGKSIGGGIC